LLDRNLSFPDGLLSLAQHAGVPIVPYWIDFDLPNRKRRFCIGEPLDPSDVAGTLQSVADILDRQIRRMPEAWFFWPELPQWIVDAAKSERPD
jgi:phosphatidylinositol dimannoside acyltransferase